MSSCGFRADDMPPDVRNGIVEISGRCCPVALEGSWAFWAGRFVEPGVKTEGFGNFARFPASWSTYGAGDLPRQGYASYAVTIRGLDPTIPYACWFPGYSCAVRWYADGKEFYACGTPSTDRAAERPGWDSAVVPLPASGAREVTLVLHLSSFNDLYSAGTVPVFFGSFEELSRARSHKRILLIVPFGAILAMSAYFISLFVLHRRDRPALWLGFLALVFALRLTCYDEYLIQDVLPALPTWLMFRLGYLTFALAAAGFTGFVRAQFPKSSHRAVVRTVLGVSLAYGAGILVFPVRVFTALLVPFQIFTLCSALYVGLVIARAVMAKNEGASLFLAGFGVFFLMAVRDVLIANRLIGGTFLAHYGILAMLTAMSLIILRRFSRAFADEERLSGDLRRINASLVRFVPNDFLRYLEKASINEIKLGDNALKDMCVMFVHLGMDLPLSSEGARLGMLEMFNEILLRVNPVIQENGGFIDKYLAEGLLALFPDDSESAVTCALRIAQVIEAYNLERFAAGLPRIRYAAGLHRGTLMLGTIGEAERMDGTVISDVVNTASRLKSFALARGRGIILSAEVALSLPEQPAGQSGRAEYALESLGEVHLRGRARPVSVFEARLP